MISKISFGSTFKVSTKNNNLDNFLMFNSFAVDKRILKDAYLEIKDETIDKYPYRYNADTTLIVPDFMDKEIEIFCANKGIKFVKLSPAINEEAICDRIKQPPKGCAKAFVSVDVLEKLLLRQDTNINSCKEDYNNYFKNIVNIMLKKGDSLSAPTFVIRNNHGDGTVEDIVDYISKYGCDNLNDGQTFIGLDQRTDEPEHCLFFALRNAGFKNIPVYVDAETLKIGSALGILKS